MASTRFEGNEFVIQVIAKGAFVDNGTYVDSSYLVEATTIRLNHVALNAWILSECFNTRDCYEDGEKGDAEWKAHKAEYEERRKTWKDQIFEALELEIDTENEGVSITQSQSEVFTVVRISKIA
ncbi:hypothetical protein [Desulfosporosinus sp. OT]|uniref:hypothetical protein n=1 Tax=Desulfosporosinus sp. OT TaxID=913865 RepID=UPI000223A507|nr:hypothetical protein [Desulfosporosinus sp. OT]EGW36431.1 hypothetical protein DOT_5684 [Desulfosporosinus sp. OT]